MKQAILSTIIALSFSTAFAADKPNEMVKAKCKPDQVAVQFTTDNGQKFVGSVKKQDIPKLKKAKSITAFEICRPTIFGVGVQCYNNGINLN